MSLRSPIKHENKDLVMPAWMAGIQHAWMRLGTSMLTGFQQSMLE
jgi:hypothetical protein